jgi:hypothetical protein
MYPFQPAFHVCLLCCPVNPMKAEAGLLCTPISAAQYSVAGFELK